MRPFDTAPPAAAQHRRSLLPTLHVVLAALVLAIAPAWSGSKAAAPPKPLANADVIRLAKMALGDDFVVAKIAKAESVALVADDAAIAELRGAGVSDRVIEAVRTRAAGGTVTGPRPPGALHVVARLAGGPAEIAPLAGSATTVELFTRALVYYQFAGAHAVLRVHEARPSLEVESAEDPSATAFLVRCDAEEKERRRSVKMGRWFGGDNARSAQPDKGWVVPVQITATGPGAWRITPLEDLESGEEYGLYHRGELFGFGVDDHAAQGESK